MYKIIGADQREYGPCSADELRRWFREGRLNAQSLVRAEGGTEWKPFAAFPEFAPLLSGATPPPPPTIGPTTGTSAGDPRPTEPVPAAELEQRDYDLNISTCFSRGWSLLTKNFWPTVGISLLVLVANSAVSQIIWKIVYPSFGSTLMESIENPPSGNMLSQFLSADSVERFEIIGFLVAIVKPLFLGGLFYYYLKLIRGQKAELADAFAGFRFAAGQLLLLGLVTSLLKGVGWMLCIVPGVYLTVVWAFCLPLMMDRQMSFWAAMELSRKVVSKHWFLIFGLVLLYMLVGSLGELACCVQYVTWPLAYLFMLYAYEDIFGHRTAAQI